MLAKLSSMARPSFMKASILLAILGLSLLASTEGQFVTRRKARVQIINESGRTIQPDSIFVAHKYSDDYKNQLKFSKVLRDGERDNGGGRQTVDYHTGFATGLDWWYVTWVFVDNQAIYQTSPNNFRCFIDEVANFGQEAIRTASDAIADVATCGFPPIPGCSASEFAAEGATIAAYVISRSLLNNEETCGFKQYILESEDDMNSSPNTYVTITIKRDGGLSFTSPSGSTETVYEEIEIRPDGKVIIDEAKFSTTYDAAAARAFGVKTPSCAAMNRGADYLVQSVDSGIF